MVVTVAGSFVIEKRVQESLDRGSHHPTSQLITFTTYIQLYRILIFQVLHRMYINRKQSKHLFLKWETAVIYQTFKYYQIFVLLSRAFRISRMKGHHLDFAPKSFTNFPSSSPT